MATTIDGSTGIDKINAELAGVAQTTSVVNTAGQNWSGVTYTDPDAVGSNPTAKIYPDGSVVGSTDNGSYTKYPDGTYIMNVETTITSYAWTANGSVYYSLHPILDNVYPMDTNLITPRSATIGRNVRGTGVAWTSVRSIHSDRVNVCLWQASTSTSGSYYLNIEINGRWF